MKIEKGKTKLILGIETSTQSGGAAICGDGVILGSILFNSKKTYSRRLLKSIDFLMRELEIEISDLNAIAVSIGPGSFTGVRIGLSIAKGLAYSAGKPLLGISSLLALASRIAETGKILVPVIDAYRGEIFYQQFYYDDKDKNILPYNGSEPAICTIEDCMKSIPEGALLAGNGIARYFDAVKNSGKIFNTASPQRNENSPDETALLGYKKYIENSEPGISSDIGEDLEPIYLRSATHVPAKKE